MLSDLLVSAPSGRLYKALVETKKATGWTAGSTPGMIPECWKSLRKVGNNSTPEEVRDIMLGVIENIAKQPATKEEVDRARQRFKADFELTMAKSKQIAIVLSEWIGAGDWRLMFLYRDRVAKVALPPRMGWRPSICCAATARSACIFQPRNPRAKIPQVVDVAKLVKDYRGSKGIAAGKAFDPTPANIESQVKRMTLPGGLKIALLAKSTRGEAVVGALTLRFGNEKSLFDYKTAAGFLGPLMRRGTKKHTRLEIDDLLNKLEATLSASSSPGKLSFSWQAKRSKLPAVLDLLGEIVRSPSFPAKEFGILKRADQQALEKGLTDPQSLAVRYISRQLHPYAEDDIRYRPTIKESMQRLEATTVDQVAKLYAEQLGGDKGELVLVGDFDVTGAVKQVESMLADWKAGVPYGRIAETARLVKGGRKDIDTPDKENAIYLAGETFPLTDTDPDYPALKLGNFILGGSPTARLFDRLRQKEGISYGAGSQVRVESQDKYAQFLVFAICNPQNLDKADKAALNVVGRTLKEGITEDELVTAKKAFLQELKVERASDSNLAGDLRALLYLGRTFDYYADLETKIAALTVADVNRALARHLSVERLVIVPHRRFQQEEISSWLTTLPF